LFNKKKLKFTIFEFKKKKKQLLKKKLEISKKYKNIKYKNITKNLNL
jgi:hypothetical protein